MLCLLCDIASYCNIPKSKLGFGFEGMKRKENSGFWLPLPSVTERRGPSEHGGMCTCRRPVSGGKMEFGLLRVEKKPFRLEPSLNRDHAKPQEGAQVGSKPDELGSLFP